MLNLSTENWEIKNIDTVLFDKDGTFIDLHYFWGKMTELRAEEVIKRFDMKPELFSNLCLSLGYDNESCKMLKDGITALYSRQKIIEIFKGNLKDLGVDTTDKVLETIFDEVSDKFYKDMQKYTKPIDSAISFIRELNKNGIKCGIVTSDSVESTKLTLKHFGWENLFGVVIGRESTKENKESGVGTRMALDILNSNPQNTVMIGDAPMDYIAAKNAGIENTILVATGQIEKDDLFKTSPYVVKELSKIDFN